MRRRGFIRGLGLGGVLGGAVSGTARARPAEAGSTRRDLAWARARVEEGHRVRLEKWGMEKVPQLDSEEGVVTIRQGSRSGIVNLDELVVTVEILEGPWEVVPEEDHPKPPQPRGREPDEFWIAEVAGGDVRPSPSSRCRTSCCPVCQGTAAHPPRASPGVSSALVEFSRG